MGVSLKKADVARWSEHQFLEWFALVHHFCPRGEWMWNDLSIKTFCQQAETRPLWEEIVWRYGFQSELRPVTIGKSIMGFLRHVGEYLQNHPHMITPKMREIMLGNEKLIKYTEPFKVVENEIGAKVVVPNMDDQSRLMLPEVQYHKALLRMSSLANDLLDGITKRHIDKMAPDERIKLMIRIVDTMSKVQGGQRPNVQIFKQLVVNSAGREELEKAMLAYTQE